VSNTFGLAIRLCVGPQACATYHVSPIKLTYVCMYVCVCVQGVCGTAKVRGVRGSSWPTSTHK